jgi:ATP-dependent protease ClpP protease subunit
MPNSMVLFLLFWLNVLACADTFRQKAGDGAVYTGYATQEAQDGHHTVFTQEKGPLVLNLSEYTVEVNAKGRTAHVAALAINDVIQYDYQAAAFERAIIEEADKGPLFILIELDTPGGRVDLAKRICAAIIGIENCQTAAFIKGGKTGGAYSAGAAIAMACDLLYMVPGTSIGAATMMASTEAGMVDMKEAYGDTIGEKFDSAWRNYLASLAQENHRSGALAKAMADKDIVVVEVKRNGQSVFIEQSQQYPNDQYVHTVCPKGELLTMPANDAVSCRFANGLASSRGELLAVLGYPDAAVIESQTLLESDEEFDKVVRKFNKLNDDLDLKFKEIAAKSQRRSLTRNQAVKDFDKLVKNAEYLLKLKRNYPDIPVSEESIIELVNSMKAEYSSIKAMR